MPANPIEYHDFAKDIASLYETEIAKRTAVSRLYYSVYLHARHRFSINTRRRSHEAVKNAIQKATQRSTGSQVGQLRELREMADYELNHDGWSEKYTRATRLTDHIMSALQRRGHA